MNSPNKIPNGTDFTFRANSDLNMPPTSPLNIEPRMMVIISGRTSGVNQADAPSIAPSTAPKINPSKILFIDIASTLEMTPIAAAFSPALLLFTTVLEISLGLSVKKVEDEEPHH